MYLKEKKEVNMETKVIEIKTNNKNEMIDITHRVQHIVSNSDITDGYIILFVPHTTAAVTVNENTDPDVQNDMLYGLNKIIPNMKEFNHYEGNSDAHIKSSLVGVDQMILIENKRLILGTWQAIYFCEFDGARYRKLLIKLIKA